ncbi:MAG: hypothetical protein JJU33_11580 [Phycisphaerales bacterium]|nr:hypothetical protein [Phycisphaerales bacterium]
MQYIKRSGQKMLDGSIVVAAIVVMALGAAALASGGIHSPGWQWGQQNCNPNVPEHGVNTFAQCLSCCNNMTYDPDPKINEDVEIPQCYGYCCVAFASTGPHPECETED